jgi:long-chain acyl-CoA synthetase
MQITQGLIRASRIRGRGIATVYRGRTRTWAEVLERVSRLGAALRTLGVKADNAVAILAQNSDRYLEYVYGTLWAGGVIDPMNTRHSKDELLYCLRDSRAEVLFADRSSWDLIQSLRAEARDLRHIVFCDDGPVPEGCLSHEGLIDCYTPCSDARRSFNDVAAIFYTGGTTGRAKGVLLTHLNIVSSCCNGYAERYAEEGSSILHTAPLFHLSGAANLFAATLRAGQQIFLERFNPPEVLECIHQYRPKSIILAPTMLQMLMDAPGFERYDLSSLEQIMYGSAPMPVPLLKRALEVMPRNVGFRQGYGMTETAAGGTILGPQWHDLKGPKPERLKSAGRSAMLCEVIVADENDRELPAGAVGEVLIRGPTVMKGYLNLPEETAQALRDGWMHTGDVGYFDDDGFLYLVDRRKDMIITGGENVYSSEVESVICQIDGVRQCAVIGIPHEKWGEAVHAIVVPVEGKSLTSEEVIACSRDKLSRYKCPRTVEIRATPLPITPAGKIQKNLLRQPFWEGRGSKLA